MAAEEPFLTVHNFNSFVPIAQKSGQAVVLGRLSRSMCLLLALYKHCLSLGWLDAPLLVIRTESTV